MAELEAQGLARRGIGDMGPGWLIEDAGWHVLRERGFYTDEEDA